MALDITMDDLIGSMQHGFHAGDRGRELQQIRDGLAFALAPHTMGTGSSSSTAAAAAAVSSSSSSTHQSNGGMLINGHAQPFAIARPGGQHGHAFRDSAGPGSGSGLGGGGLVGASPSSTGSSSGSYARYGHTSAAIPTGLPTSTSFSPDSSRQPCISSPPGSVSSAGSFGYMGSQAPANTPMQTPVERAGSHWPRQQQTQLQHHPHADNITSSSNNSGGSDGAHQGAGLEVGGQRTPIHQAFAFALQGGAPPNSPAQLAPSGSEAGLDWTTAPGSSSSAMTSTPTSGFDTGGRLAHV
ncbi:hypothetical protein V8E36_001928 [Tilletia maclaganii]